jgi:FAM72 protein
MSPAPETVQRPQNSSSSTSISISSILSRSLRAPSDSHVDRRGNGSEREGAPVRRYVSGGPRPAPFHRQMNTLHSIGGRYTRSTETLHQDGDEWLEQTDRVRPRQSNVTSLIADEWRWQRQSLQTTAWTGTRTRTTSRQRTPSPVLATGSPRTPPPLRDFGPPRVFIGGDSSESESEEDDDSDNKFPNPINELGRTPSPTFLTPDTSPSTQSNISTSPGDEESSRNLYTLSCRFCANVLTKRGMRARLVADARVHIWSTDEPPKYHFSGL